MLNVKGVARTKLRVVVTIARDDSNQKSRAVVLLVLSCCTLELSFYKIICLSFDATVEALFYMWVPINVSCLHIEVEVLCALCCMPQSRSSASTLRTATFRMTTLRCDHKMSSAVLWCVRNGMQCTTNCALSLWMPFHNALWPSQTGGLGGWRKSWHPMREAREGRGANGGDDPPKTFD